MSEQQDAIDAEGEWTTGTSRSVPAEPTEISYHLKTTDETNAQTGSKSAHDDVGSGDVGSNDNK